MAQISMLANLAACGCVLVPFAKVTRGFDVAGMHWGPHVRITGADMIPLAPEALPAEALEGAFHHGAAIARVAGALKRQSADGRLFDRGARFPSPELRAEGARRDGMGAQAEPR
jgi:NAD(P)H dehydrogenase (quinone)